MNEPIISPWLFYLIYAISNIQNFLLVAGLVAMSIAASMAIFSSERATIAKRNRCYGEPVEDYVNTIKNAAEEAQNLWKGFKRYGVIGLTMFIIGILTPNEEVMYRMAVAQYVTPNNIEWVTEKTGEAIDGGIDYMIDKIIEAADKWEQRKND